MRVAFAADSPLSRSRIVLRDDRQHPVILGRRFTIAVLRADSSVLLLERGRTIRSRSSQESIDSLATLVPLRTGDAWKRAAGILHQWSATFGTCELWQPHTG